ncbi:unnamed protein product, partial [Tetraodon nigroviridis]
VFQLHSYLEPFRLSLEKLQEVSNRLRKDMIRGLKKHSHQNAPVKMLPTFVRATPDGTEKGDFLALDLGGTNFRVLHVRVVEEEQKVLKMDSQICTIPKEMMLGPGEKLFDHIAACLSEFISSRNLKGQTLPLGFTFSFPCEQKEIDKSILIRWTKGFKCSGVEGEDVVRLLKEAIRRRGDYEIGTVAMVNDTVGTMMSCGYRDQSCEIGLIIGTGTNACYMEEMKNVKRVEGEDGRMCINTEWGGFGDDGALKDIQTTFDVTVDETSVNPGVHIFEKMISGMYLGEIVRLLLVKLTEDQLLFGGQASEALLTPETFETKFISQIEEEEHSLENARTILTRLGLDWDEVDARIVRVCCDTISSRSARLCAAALAAIADRIRTNRRMERLKTTVGVDGTVYKKHPNFSDELQATVRLLAPACDIRFLVSEDGSGKGAAMFGASGGNFCTSLQVRGCRWSERPAGGAVSPWSGAPSCQRGSYAFYKSVSSRAQPDGPLQLWKLGEFYFIRCGPQDPVCIAEVTLLWEDRTQHHLLASTRLYFLPEDTPKGRTREHGEVGAARLHTKIPTVKAERSRRSSGGVQEDGGDPVGANGVKVLSYPQYCRFRSLQRRILERARAPGLQDPHLLALGGVRALPTTRLMYCRDTFSHPALENSAEFSWQLRERDGQRGGRLRGRLAPSPRRAALPGPAVRLHGAAGLPHPQSPPPGLQKDRPLPHVFCRETPGRLQKGKAATSPPDLLVHFHPACRSSASRFLAGVYAEVHRKEALACWFCSSVSLGIMIRTGTGGERQRLDFLSLRLPRAALCRIRLGGTISEQSVVFQSLGGKQQQVLVFLCVLLLSHILFPHQMSQRMQDSVEMVTILSFALQVTLDRLWKVVYNELGGCPGSTSAATCTRRHYERLMLPYEEHLRAGAAEFKIPESPMPPKARGMKGGRKPLPRGRRPGAKAKEKRIGAPAASPSAGALAKRGRGRPPGTRNKTTLMAEAKLLSQQEAPARAAAHGTPRPKPKEQKAEAVEPAASPRSLILSAFPRHFVGGSLSGFSPTKGVCPLDVFRSRMSLQRTLESPALTPQDPPNGVQKGGPREGRGRPPLPPLRVLPLNLDCSVQVNQLMRTRLGSAQFQTFTRCLSEALSHDLGAKPPCAPITPPPEQALPLNLSKRFAAKRPGAAEAPDPSLGPVLGNQEQPPSKRARVVGCPAQAEDLSQRTAPVSAGTGGAGQNLKNQEEPADLSSPSRIRAFLLGLPPFQVKFEEDLNGTRFGRLLAPGSKAEPPRTQSQTAEGLVAVKPEQAEGADTEVKLQKQEEMEPLPSSLVQLS